MAQYNGIFPAVLGSFKQQISIIPREPGPPDSKGRATWTEGAPISEAEIVQPISGTIERGERSEVITEGLNIFLSLSAPIRAQDLIEYKGRRYGIITLHKTDLQQELTVKEAMA